MLTPEQIRAVANDVTSIYSGVETACIESIVKRIQAGKKITSASLWQMKKLNDVGLLRRELIQEIKKQTKLAFPEIERLIKTAVKQSRSANALSLEGLKTYKGTPKANLLSALSQSDSLAKTVKKLTASARSMFNLTNTQATQASVRAYVSSINKAYLAMSTGNATREEAIKQAVEEIGKSGIKIVDSKKKVTDNELVRKKGETYTTYNNGSLRLYPLDSAIRRDFVTMVNQSTADLTISDCNDLGTHLVETSWHNGARPEHEVWQGKVFSLDPNDTRYPYFYGSLDAGLPDYGNPLGICGINCYHSFYPYFEGTEKTSKKGKKSAEENNKQYEQQQVQRSYERRLRQLKREQVAYRAGGYTEDAQRVQALINKTSKNYGQFLRDTGLTRVSMLERVEGYKRMAVSKTPTTTPKPAPQKAPSIPTNPRKFDKMSYSEANTYAKEHFFDEAYKRLTQEEKDKIYDYTGSAYTIYNGILRHPENYELSTIRYYKAHTDLCQSGLLKNAIDEDIQVYRGISNTRVFAEIFGVTKDELLDKSNWSNFIGMEYDDKGFTSTGIFWEDGWDKEVKATILLPKGSHGMYVDPMSSHGGEKEFLLPAGTKFKILEIENLNGEYHKIWLKVLAITP